MKTSLVTKLESLCDRHEEVAALLADAETASDPNKFRALSQEYAQLDDVVKVYDGYRRSKDDLAEAQLMLEDSDPDVREMAEEEISAAESHMSSAEAALQVLMLPKDPKDKSNARIRQAEGYKLEVVANAEGEVARFTNLLEEYSKAPEVTRDRLYLDALQSVLSNSTKVMVDVEGGNNLLYLPLDKIMEENKKQENSRINLRRVDDE